MHDFDGLSLDDLPDAIIATAADGRVTGWNSAAAALFGYDTGQALGQALNALIAPAVPGIGAADLRQVVAAGAPAAEVIRRRRDGTLIYVDVTASACRMPPGEAPGVLYSYKDVTHLKVRRDAKLVATRYGNLLESAPDGIVMVNAIGRIVFANPQAETLFGYGAGELLGLAVELLLPQRFRAAHVGHRGGYGAQPRQRAMGAGLQLFGLRKDDVEFPVEISLSPLATDEGTLIMSAIRDIGERKRFEQALQDKNIELANALQARDRFLAGMSHELRTPLNAVIGFTGTLLMRLPGPLTTDQERQLRIVQSSARHLLALINDLLDLARVEADKLELVAEAIDGGELLRDVAATLRPQAESKGLEFSVEVAPDLPVLNGDRRLLKQILLNLLANAIKFTDAGSVRARYAWHTGASAALPAFIIEDTGIGIAPADQQRVFEAFARLRPGGDREREGSGLGLHLSQRLARRLGAEITFTSTPGQGSCFVLTLPAA